MRDLEQAPSGRVGDLLGEQIRDGARDERAGSPELVCDVREELCLGSIQLGELVKKTQDGEIQSQIDEEERGREEAGLVMRQSSTRKDGYERKRGVLTSCA